MGGMIEDEGPVAGRIPKSSMFDAAREFMPDVDRRFVRQAYRAAKRQGREAGNTGTYLRQDARDRVIEKFRKNRYSYVWFSMQKLIKCNSWN